jgi:hypothetical protein
LNKKIQLKERERIKMKNKLEGNKIFFDWKVKLKRKITLTKKNQKNKD